jgi:AraC-like DNA-binding protein
VSDQSETVDNEVLQLRRQGRSYARISRELGLERAAVAQKAFRRAVGRLPEADAKRARDEEVSRLDRLAAQVRADTTKDDLDRTRQLKTIERMLDRIHQDPLT